MGNVMKINADVNGDGWHKDKDGWEHHRYRVVLAVDGRAMTVNFRQGMGVDDDPDALRVLESVFADTIDMVELMERADQGEAFEEWAGNVGYDPDSREAERLYRACGDQALELRKLVGHEGWVALTGELLADGAELVGGALGRGDIVSADPTVVGMCWKCDGLILDPDWHDDDGHPFHPECCPRCNGVLPEPPPSRWAEEVDGWTELGMVFLGALALLILMAPTLIRGA